MCLLGDVKNRNLFAVRVVAKKNKREQEGVADILHSSFVAPHPSAPTLGGFGFLWTEDGSREEIRSEVRIKALKSLLHQHSVRNRHIPEHLPATGARFSLTLCTYLRALLCDSAELAPTIDIIYIRWET